MYVPNFRLISATYTKRHVKDTCRSRADCSTLIKAQLSALNVATERGTSDKMEATRFSQYVHDQRRRLEAEDCDSIHCAQLISGGRRRIRPPNCLAHAHPTMCCIRLVMIASLTSGSNMDMDKDQTVMFRLRRLERNSMCHSHTHEHLQMHSTRAAS